MLLWDKWSSFLESILPRLWADFASQKEEKESSEPYFFARCHSPTRVYERNICGKAIYALRKATADSESIAGSGESISAHPPQNKAHNLPCTTCIFLACAETL